MVTQVGSQVRGGGAVGVTARQYDQDGQRKEDSTLHWYR